MRVFGRLCVLKWVNKIYHSLFRVLLIKNGEMEFVNFLKLCFV